MSKRMPSKGGEIFGNLMTNKLKYIIMYKNYVRITSHAYMCYK